VDQPQNEELHEGQDIGAVDPGMQLWMSENVTVATSVRATLIVVNGYDVVAGR